ncbi:MAG: hypothetical protein R3C18_24300 [Planctomycetaceae bacterium]
MIPLFLLGEVHTEYRQSAVEIDVECEACGHRYWYEAERSAESQGFSPLYLDGAGARRRAREDVERKLKRAFQNAVEVVPCPECGHYQAEMLPFVRKTYYWFFVPVAVVCFLAAGVVFVAGVVSDEHALSGEIPAWSTVPAATLPLLGLLLLGTRWGLTLASDPNAEPREARIELGKKRANKRKHR